MKVALSKANEPFSTGGHSGMISIRVVSIGPTLTPIEGSGIDEQAVAEVKATGSCKGYEKEYSSKRWRTRACCVGGAARRTPGPRAVPS